MKHRQIERSAPKPNQERKRDAEDKALVGHAWAPIQPLTNRDLERSFGSEDEWRQRYEELLIRRYYSSDFWDRFTLGLHRLHHSMAIETGVIEGLYNTRQDVTETLLREGFDNVDHVRTEGVDVEPEHLINVLADHFEAHGMVMGFHQENHPFGKHAMRELHAKITAHQETHVAVDSLGRHVHRPLRKGAFKLYPNNPTRTDGRVHQYAPPEQVEPQLDHLLELYDQYREAHHPLLVGAWLHHRFIQIHPFADGNGRTGRMLLNWHLYGAGWLPVLVDRRDRNAYLYALDQADAGDLSVLVDFLAATSQQSIRFVMHEFSAGERLQVLGSDDPGNVFRKGDPFAAHPRNLRSAIGRRTSADGRVANLDGAESRRSEGNRANQASSGSIRPARPGAEGLADTGNRSTAPPAEPCGRGARPDSTALEALAA